MSAYKQLEEQFKKICLLNECSTFLGWDNEVMMPPSGAESRGEQLALLGVLSHDFLTDKKVADLLGQAEEDQLDGWQQANLKEMQRQYQLASCIPADLVSQLIKQANKTERRWRDAKKDNDFAGVKPLLEELLNLTKQKAAAMAKALGTSEYDALLNEYEPYGVSAEIDGVFDDLATFLPNFIDDVLTKQKQNKIDPIPVAQPIEKQRLLTRRILDVLGYDFNHGRFDESAHPFSTGTKDDSRITTRYVEDDFASALMGVIHESGHGFYTMGTPQDWRYQPVAMERGLTLHESQSLGLEMQACRSAEFLQFLTPLLNECFSPSTPWSFEQVKRTYHHVERSLIRIDADEVTYPLHVIIRYRLEKQLILGDLGVKDLPAAWNDAYQDLLGITPPDDARGCLQDIHWYWGSFGYFSTYTLGALAAAQLCAAAKRDDATIWPSLAEGNFKPYLTWMGQNVHQQGSRFTTQEILQNATGKPLSADAFKAHVQQRYMSD